jgi:hypothetical protein
VKLRGSPLVYLKVQLDPQRRQTTITHEAVVRVGQTFHSFYLIFVRTESGKVGSLAAKGADAIVRADRRRPVDPAERGPDILLDAAGARHMARYLRAGWKDDKEIHAKGRCPGSGHWPGRLNTMNPIRDPGWTCMEYLKTRVSKGDTVMRVLFDHIRDDTIILHAVAVRLGLRASGGPQWLTRSGEDPRYSSCKYVVAFLDWKGRREWIRARGVSYTTPSEQRDAP